MYKCVFEILVVSKTWIVFGRTILRTLVFAFVGRVCSNFVVDETLESGSKTVCIIGGKFVVLDERFADCIESCLSYIFIVSESTDGAS